MALFNRIGSLRGGLYLPLARVDTAEHPIQVLDVPPVLRVPLAQSSEAAAAPLVREHQKVTTGEPLAESSATIGRVHSPADGAVARLTRVTTPYQVDVSAVEIHVTTARQADDGPIDWTSFPASVVELIESAGALGVNLPDADALLRRRSVRHILIQGLDSEPQQSANFRTVLDHADDVLRAAAVLHSVLAAGRTHLVVPSDRSGAVRALKDVARGSPVRVMGLPNKYPHSMPALLGRAILGVEIPCGKRPIDEGIWVVDARTVFDLIEAIGRRQPVIRQTMTVAGDAVRTPGNYRFALGSTIRDVLDRIGLAATPREIVVGDVLAGAAVATPDTVLTKRTRCLTLRSRGIRVRREPVTCIRCGSCQDVCPVQLDPRALLDAAERRRADLAAALHPLACVQCGLCDYVCPSSLPLMRAARWSQGHVALD